jgi:hypothetical protein
LVGAITNQVKETMAMVDAAATFVSSNAGMTKAEVGHGPCSAKGET